MKRAVVIAVPGHIPGTWWTVDHPKRGVCLPGGKIEPEDRDARAAAWREMGEETGVWLLPQEMYEIGAGIVPGAVPFQVTAYRARFPSFRRWGPGEADMRARMRQLSELRSCAWAMQYDFHRAIYDRLARDARKIWGYE